MPKKILILLPTLASGGAERQAAELARHLDRDQFEPLVVAIYGFDTVPVEIGLENVRLTSLRKPLGKLGNLIALARLWRLIRTERPAICQSFLRLADLYLRIAAPLAGHRRIITSLRTRIGGFWSEPWQRLERLLWRLSTCIVSNSSTAAREAETLLGVPASRLRVIPNGVDLERFHPGMDWRAPRAEYGLAASDLVFGMVARYAPVKDHATLLDAVARLRDAGEWPAYARILLVGGTTYPEARKAVEDRIAVLRLQSIVIPAGVTREVAGVYAALDWLILPSKFEGFPNSVLEAMACAKPALVSTAANAERIVTEPEMGFEFPAGDVAALAGLLRRAIQIPAAERIAMGRQARRFVEGQFSTHLLAHRHEALYRELLGSA